MNVQIVTLLALAGALAWSGGEAPTSEPPDWTLREELRLDSRHGPDDVTQVAVGRDGAIYVLSPRTGITVFDRGGAVVRRVRVPDSVIVSGLRELAESALSRRRDGLSPSQEVGAVPRIWSSMGWLGDTLWVIDRSTRRVQLLGAQGNSVGAIPFTRDVEGGRAGTALAVLADRSLLRGVVVDDRHSRAPTYPRSTPPGQYRMPIIPGPALPGESLPHQGFLVRTTPDGTVLQGLEIFVEPRQSIIVRSPYGSTRFPYPFQDNPFIGVSPDGREVVFVERYAATRPGPARYYIARFDVATGRRSARFHEYTPSPITPETIDSILTRLVSSAATSEHRRFAYAFQSPAEAKVALRAALDAPSFHAPVSDMVVGADRTVWLEERAAGRWLAHTPDGRIAGRVSLPSGARLVFADLDTMWVATTAPDGKAGSQYVVRYRIVRR